MNRNTSQGPEAHFPMKTPFHQVTTCAVAVVLALLSWLTVSAGGPTITSPFNILVVAPSLGIYSLLGSRGVFVGVAVVPVAFSLWSWPVLRRGARLPDRSVVLLAVTVWLSGLWLVSGWRYGVEYQGVHYVVGVAITNIICWVSLVGLAFFARRGPSFALNLGFHAALFGWLAWYAFPYLGELP